MPSPHGAFSGRWGLPETGSGLPTVVVVGSAHMDLIATADRLPVRGETLPGRHLGIHPGGKGLNQAVQVALAGARSVFLGRLGGDDFGRRLRSSLVEKGVVTDWLRDDERLATGASTVFVGEDGDYCSVVFPGAGLSLSKEDIAEARDAFAGARAVVAQLELPVETIGSALEIGRRVGATTILNAAPAPESAAVLASIFPLVDILVVNQVEAAMLVGGGKGGGANAEAREVLRQICSDHGIGSAVLTLGSDGAVVLAEGRLEEIIGHRVAVVDDIGAGDAFVGTMVAHLAGGAALTTATRRGNAAGALAVTGSGAYDSLPSAAAVDQFLKAGIRAAGTRLAQASAVVAPRPASTTKFAS